MSAHGNKNADSPPYGPHHNPVSPSTAAYRHTFKSSSTTTPDSSNHCATPHVRVRFTCAPPCTSANSERDPYRTSAPADAKTLTPTSSRRTQEPSSAYTREPASAPTVTPSPAYTVAPLSATTPASLSTPEHTQASTRTREPSHAATRSHAPQHRASTHVDISGLRVIEYRRKRKHPARKRNTP